MRLNIENNYVFVRIIKLAIMFAGIVKYCLQFALEGVETFAESIKVNKYIPGKKLEKTFCRIDCKSSKIYLNEIEPCTEKSITMEGMTLFIFHVIVVGILIAVTAFIAYNAGKNTGRFISEEQDNRNVQRK